MDVVARRRLEMGLRVLNFSRAHPHTDAGYAAAVAGLEQGLARAEVLAMQQRSGTIAERATTARKRELRDQLRNLLLGHLAHVAHTARLEVPELAKRFRVPLDNRSYQSLRIAARVVAQEAREQKDLLVRYGLAEPMLTGLEQAVAQLDEAVEQGGVARRTHAGARLELDDALADVVAAVHVIDDFNRFRFAKGSDELGAWITARTMPARTRKSGEEDTPSSPDALKPAA